MAVAQLRKAGSRTQVGPGSLVARPWRPPSAGDALEGVRLDEAEQVARDPASRTASATRPAGTGSPGCSRAACRRAARAGGRAEAVPRRTRRPAAGDAGSSPRAGVPSAGRAGCLPGRRRYRAGLEPVIRPFGYRDAARFRGITDPGLAVLAHSVVGRMVAGPCHACSFGQIEFFLRTDLPICTYLRASGASVSSPSAGGARCPARE
jgi:hypothetical protein